MKLLNDQTALVTGASGGIGRAIALKLAQLGARVAVHYNGNRQRALETVGMIEAEGGSALAIGADLRNPKDISAMFDSLSEHNFVTLDILVNNAGIGLNGRLDGTSEADFDLMFDTNVKGTFFVTQAGLPRMRDGGVIINISSMASIPAYPDLIAYAMSKAALNMFTRSLAVDVGPRQIKVNAIAPGATATDFIGYLTSNPDARAALEGASVFGRLGQPEDIASVVEFLVSPGGQWITGQVIQASGGMHL